MEPTATTKPAFVQHSSSKMTYSSLLSVWEWFGVGDSAAHDADGGVPGRDSKFGKTGGARTFYLR
jgi:hypothetical protein